MAPHVFAPSLATGQCIIAWLFSSLPSRSPLQSLVQRPPSPRMDDTTHNKVANSTNKVNAVTKAAERWPSVQSGCSTACRPGSIPTSQRQVQWGMLITPVLGKQRLADPRGLVTSQSSLIKGSCPPKTVQVTPETDLIRICMPPLSSDVCLHTHKHHCILIHTHISMIK